MATKKPYGARSAQEEKNDQAATLENFRASGRTLAEASLAELDALNSKMHLETTIEPWEDGSLVWSVCPGAGRVWSAKDIILDLREASGKTLNLERSTSRLLNLGSCGLAILASIVGVKTFGWWSLLATAPGIFLILAAATFFATIYMRWTVWLATVGLLASSVNFAIHQRELDSRFWLFLSGSVLFAVLHQVATEVFLHNLALVNWKTEGVLERRKIVSKEYI